MPPSDWSLKTESAELAGIEKTCPICSVRFHSCENCWRGQKYCSRECSREGRKRNRRLTERRYAATEKGRESRRRRQKNFRIRKILGLRVTDHSPRASPIIIRQHPNHKDQTQKRCRHCQRRIRVVVSGGLFAVSEKDNHFSFARLR